jgi:DoxX-like family
LDLGAYAGDCAARLGWTPPLRTTALAELRRGVLGDPGPWIESTGIQPRPIGCVLMDRPATIQERWFARLYLLKPVVIATLVVFWSASGLIALTVAYNAAVATLTARGFPVVPAHAITIASSGVDIAVGIAIGVRRTCRAGLLAGIAVSVFYMVGAAVLTPDLWIEPLGALVKTGPAIALMAVALATLDKR